MRLWFLAFLMMLSTVSAASYRVKPGDTLGGIAARSGISAAQIRAANPQLRGDVVKLGQVLRLPDRATPAQKYHVQRGENLTTIARRFGLSTAQLIRANPVYRGGKNIWAGAVITIPARPALSRIQAAPTSRWLWPLPGHHSVSSGFGPRLLEGKTAMHYGVDIVAPLGTPVLAARSGRVLESRLDYERGWGWTVVLQHPDGWITRYAHLSQNLVRRGELVRQGQRVGRVGNTGHSTGPHLHYGTYLRWNPHDPLSLY